jgi:hypothetical protein
LAAEFPPRSRRLALGVLRYGRKDVSHTRIEAPPLEGAKTCVQVVRVLLSQLLNRVDSEPEEVISDRRSDVGNLLQLKVGETITIALG